MQFLLLLHVQESGWDTLTPQRQAEGMAQYAAFNAALEEAGALIKTSSLMPSSGAATVRRGTGSRAMVLDGPFAETKEQVAGFYLIEAPDQAAAIAWAERCPAAGHGSVEVRALRGA